MRTEYERDPKRQEKQMEVFATQYFHHGAIKSGHFCPWNSWRSIRPLFTLLACKKNRLVSRFRRRVKDFRKTCDIPIPHFHRGWQFCGTKTSTPRKQKKSFWAHFLICGFVRRLSDRTPSDNHRMIIGRPSDKASDKLSDESPDFKQLACLCRIFVSMSANEGWIL